MALNYEFLIYLITFYLKLLNKLFRKEFFSFFCTMKMLLNVFDQDHAYISNIAMAKITKTDKKIFHSRKCFQKYKHLCNALFPKLIRINYSFHKRQSLKDRSSHRRCSVKKKLWHRCFPVNFGKFLRTPFVTEHLRWLLL